MTKAELLNTPGTGKEQELQKRYLRVDLSEELWFAATRSLGTLDWRKSPVREPPQSRIIVNFALWTAYERSELAENAFSGNYDANLGSPVGTIVSG